MFDHSYCQNVHSQSQNRCFKEFANFRRKIPATKRPFAWGGGVESLFGRIPFEHAVSLPGASLTASSLSLYCLVLPVVDGNGVYALWTWSGIDRAEVISFLQPLPKWTSFVNWSSLTLVVFSYFDFQNTLTVTADHFLAYKAAESFLRTTFWNGKRIWSSPLDINKLFWLKWHDHLQQCAESHSLSRGKKLIAHVQ